MKTKRLFVCLFVLVLALCLNPSVKADVVWEPDNSFYTRHASECTYENRNYRANGKDGFITLWNAPDGSEVVKQYENSGIYRVYYLWKDWGCVSAWEENKEIVGWVPLSDLTLMYDHISFEEEYKAQIKPYGGEFADYEGGDAAVNFYEYPGAPNILQSMSTEKENRIVESLTGEDGVKSYIDSIFVDENGLTWGYVSVLYGRVDGWFCLDDPDGENFPVRAVSEEGMIQPKTPVMPGKGVVTRILPWALAAAVLVVTAILLLRLRKRQSKEADAGVSGSDAVN